MLSAIDVVHKHQANHRYLYRSPDEGRLCYQLAGNEPAIMADAAVKLENLGADIIDINCGCPKTKIRKKGYGSALLEKPDQLLKIVTAIKSVINCPLTVKIRLQHSIQDIELVKSLADHGVDAVIIHGRSWTDDYSVPCNLQQIANIKNVVSIPVIANGDIKDVEMLKSAFEQTGCDAYMISRAGTGRPWLYQELLTEDAFFVEKSLVFSIFIKHLQQLSKLENEYQAVMQSRKLLHYYFREFRDVPNVLKEYCQLRTIQEIETWYFSSLCSSSG